MFATDSELPVADFCALPALPSAFDASGAEQREAVLFLERFVESISRPRTTADGQLDYVPTHVICEYLSQARPADYGPPLAGLIYPSAVRDGGRNLVLFPRRGAPWEPTWPVAFRRGEIRAVASALARREPSASV